MISQIKNIGDCVCDYFEIEFKKLKKSERFNEIYSDKKAIPKIVFWELCKKNTCYTDSVVASYLGYSSSALKKKVEKYYEEFDELPELFEVQRMYDKLEYKTDHKAKLINQKLDKIHTLQKLIRDEELEILNIKNS